MVIFMKIFDLHADIGCDVLYHHKNNEKNILDRYHTPKLLKGQVEGICMASFFSGVESWQDMQEMILTLENELNQQTVWHRILTQKDCTVDKPLAIMSVEGMCGIKEHGEKAIEWMYQHGIRVASLCWNDENACATGVKGNSKRGLSELGKTIIHKMDELHMIIDVSHANEKTFWDILNTSKGCVIATHSNASALCDHPRNLTDEQIKAIASKNGLIGMNACAYFVDHDLNKVNVDALAKHAEYIKNLVGAEYIACGFDFMDFFPDSDESTISDLQDASQAQHFIEALKNHHFTDEEIKKIAYQNVMDRISNYLV